MLLRGVVQIRFLHLYSKSLQNTFVKEFFFGKVASLRHAALLKIKSFAGSFKDFDLMCRGNYILEKLSAKYLSMYDFLEFTSIIDPFLPCKIYFHVSKMSHQKLLNIIQPHKACVDNIQSFQKQLFL